MKKKQRIPGYMKNDINKKPKVKYIEIILDVMGKIPGILPLYVTALGAFHIFLWAFNISSGSIGDTAFIIQKEGISGGIPRMLTLIVPHIMMLIIVLIPIIIVFISLHILSTKFRSRILYPLLIVFVLCIVALFIIIYIFLDSSPANKFSFDGSFVYWIEPGNIIPHLAVMCILLVIPILFFVIYREGSHKALLYRIILWGVIFSISVVPFFMFNTAYSKGYGTECISLEVEDSLIKGSEMNNAEGKEGKLKPSWVIRSGGKDNAEILDKNKGNNTIQSGGKDIAEILDKNKGNNTYVLASYVYSEDKDYLNIMVFSIRELYKDTEGKTRAKSDLLINEKNGKGKSGVLVSIKKSSIAGRYPSNPLCFPAE